MLHMAAPCPAWLKEAWIGWLGSERVWEYYGTTEGTGSTMISGTDWLAHRGSVGRVRDGYALKILDEAGSECPLGEVGEIYFRPQGGPGIHLSLSGKHAPARRRMGVPGRFGARGRGGLSLSFRPSQRPDHLGRSQHLSGRSGGGDRRPSGRPDQRGDRAAGRGVGRARPCDRPAGRGRAILDEAELLEFVAGRLTRFKLPKSIEFTSEPLRDEAGKVRRAALRETRLHCPT